VYAATKMEDSLSFPKADAIFKKTFGFSMDEIAFSFKTDLNVSLIVNELPFSSLPGL
jgi:hypothetical protein